jgi:phospholipid/cholesterol/gamma-HCH transport system ATP-binding protein
VSRAAALGRRHEHAVLEISDVVVSGTDHTHADVMRGSMRVEAGELALVQVVNLEQAEIWADIAVGLTPPERGHVSIPGNELDGLDLETGNWLRGRIGRVFSRGNWLDRLTLMDNILLQSRHHSGRCDEELKREASVLAQSFGMPGVPLGMPDHFPRIERQRAACVRAFLGNPLMVILEDPTYVARSELISPLMGAIRAARNRGAAVVWFSPSLEIWRDKTIPASRRYRMAGNELMEITRR